MKNRFVGLTARRFSSCDWRSCSLCTLFKNYLFSGRTGCPYGRPCITTIDRAIDAEVGSQVDQVCIARVLNDRVRDQTRRHAAHRWTPTLAVVVANEEEPAACGGIDRRRVNTVGRFTVGENRVCEATAKAEIGWRESLARIV